ncbi:hypothetical protein HYFRA_00012520 [Hymenoscyphus fraxineus]|uniref:CHAT domain-containing protein n=1 Tax=Hymenoscyphus fraxineus TaxID=746836 RepID=A0A9N9L0T6_9HELO|nr:hypothetical protein HYFRA_00012520 [Hymenoscyphus fraxineus]
MDLFIVLVADHYDETRRQWDIELQDTNSHVLVTGSIHNPFEDFEKEELRWYLEDFAFKNPYAKRRATTVEQSLLRYQAELFASIDPLLTWAVSQTMGEVSLTEVESIRLCIRDDSEANSVQSLYWECLEDNKTWTENMPPIYISRQNGGNKQLHELPVENTINPSCNILFVSSRVSTTDLPYRVLSKPMWEFINSHEKLRSHIKIYFARPGTWDQVKAVLHQHPKGFFSMVHFDTHGKVYKRNAGLLFSSPNRQDERGVHIKAQEIGKELLKSGVEVVILNACNTGTVTSQKLSNFAMTLLEAGVPNVVAMSFALTTEAATLFMLNLYENLFLHGKDLQMCVAQGRQKLKDNRHRRSRFAVGVDLDDSVIPVLYQRHGALIRWNMPSVSISEAVVGTVSTALEVPLPSVLIGRDMKMLSLELDFTDVGAVIMTGYAGVGKTALSRYLRDWWVHSNFFRGYIEIRFRDLENYSDEKSLYEWLSMKAGIKSESFEQSREALHQARVLVVVESIPSFLSDSVPENEGSTRRSFNLICGLSEDFSALKGHSSSRLLLISRRLPEPLGNSPLKHVILEPLAIDFAMEMSRQCISECGATFEENQASVQILRRILEEHDSNCLFIETFIPLLSLKDCSIKILYDSLKLDLPLGCTDVLRSKFEPSEITRQPQLFKQFLSITKELQEERPLAYAMLLCLASFQHALPSSARQAILAEVHSAWLRWSCSERFGEGDSAEYAEFDLNDDQLQEEYRYLMEKLEAVDLVSPLNLGATMREIHVCLPYLIRFQALKIYPESISILPNTAKQLFWKYWENVLGDFEPENGPDQVFGERRTNVHNALRLALQQPTFGEGFLNLVMYLPMDIEHMITTAEADYYELLSFVLLRFEELFQKLDSQSSSLRMEVKDASLEIKEDLFMQAFLIFFLRGWSILQMSRQTMDLASKEGMVANSHNNVLRAKVLWSIGVKHDYISPTSETFYQVIGWQDLKISQLPVEERYLAFRKQILQKPIEGSLEFAVDFHTQGKVLLLGNYILDAELQQHTGGLPMDMAQSLISTMNMENLPPIVSNGLLQWLTGQISDGSAFLPVIKAASSVDNIFSGSLKILSAVSGDSTNPQKRLMMEMDKAKEAGDVDLEVNSLKGIFSFAVDSNDYLSALDCHQRILKLKEVETKDSAAATSNTIEVGAGQREYELGLILDGDEDPDKMQKSKDHLETAVKLLREEGSSPFYLNATLSCLGSNAWKEQNFSAAIAYYMEGAWLEYNVSAAGSIEHLETIVLGWMSTNLAVGPEKYMIEEALAEAVDLPITNIQFLLEVYATHAAKGSGFGKPLTAHPINEELEYILFSGLVQYNNRPLCFWYLDETSQWMVEPKVYAAITRDWREDWFHADHLPPQVTEDVRFRHQMFPYGYVSPILEQKRDQLVTEMQQLDVD